MLVQSERFVEAHNGNRNDVSIFGQESNPTTWRLAKMNLAIRGIEADLGPKWADSFHEDLHPGLKADFVLANPPFKDTIGRRADAPGRALAIRRTAGRQRQFRLGAAFNEQPLTL